MRILAFAYACDPEQGSEPGAGWAWARMLGAVAETWVVTRANNRPAIERHVPSIPERDNLHFVYVDLPPWARRWKRGRRGIRLYYMLWQIAALIRARALERQISFDLYWHLTLANAWLGSTICLLGRPFIYGPVGGGVATPWRFLPSLGVRGAVYEVFRAIGRESGSLANPLARIALHRADVILTLNEDTRRWLPTSTRARSVVFPHTVVDDWIVDFAQRSPRSASAKAPSHHNAVFAGDLTPWKGCHLAIAALQRAPAWRLRICGSGPDESRLRDLSSALGLDDRVDFLGRLPRETVLELMVESDALLFPSLHDDAPFAVGEARTVGLAVVCLDRGGPPAIAGPAGISVPAKTPGEAIEGLARALRTVERAAERLPQDSYLTLPKTKERLRRLLKEKGLCG
jgi:glycosyltransferase involved in cell wall biosynthesis